MGEKDWFYNFVNGMTVAVDTDNLRTYSKQLKGIYENADKLGNRVLKLAKNFDAVNAARCLSDSATVLKKCKNYLDYTASAFEDTENYLSKLNPTDVNAIRFGLITASISDDPSARAVSDMALKTESIINPKKGRKISTGSTTVFETKRGGKWSVKGKAELPEEASFREKAALTKQLLQKGFALGKTAGKVSAESEESEEKKSIETDFQIFNWTILNGDFSALHLGKDSSWWDATVAKYEGHVSADGGYNKKKGWYVEAEAGASFSLLAGSLQGSLGNEVFGMHGSVNAEVGTVSGSLGFSASTKEGLEANLSLEADIIKVGGTAGITVMGVDADVSANVKVGLGFHANVGYKKGVVTCDIGAAFGLGFDIKIKVDVKKPVKAVKRAAKAAWRKVKSWF